MTPAQNKARDINWKLFRLASSLANANAVMNTLTDEHKSVKFDLVIALARLQNAITYIKENR